MAPLREASVPVMEVQTAEPIREDLSTRVRRRSWISLDNDLFEVSGQEYGQRVIDLRNKISDRIFENAVKPRLDPDSKQAVGNWITTYARERSLERIIARNRGSHEGETMSVEVTGVNPEVTNLANLRLQQLRNVIFPDEIDNEERRAYLQIGRMFLNNKGKFACLDIDDDIFDKEVIEEENFFNFAEKLGKYNIDPLSDDAPRRRFVTTGQIDVPDTASTTSRRTTREIDEPRANGRPSFSDPKVLAAQKAVRAHNLVVEKLAGLIPRVHAVNGYPEKNKLAAEFRQARDEFQEAHKQIEMNPQADSRSDDQRIADYAKTRRIINHSILVLIDQQETEKEGAVDLKVQGSSGRVMYIQKRLPEDFDFLPPLKETNANVAMARKGNHQLPRIVFNGTSFESWAAEFRDNIERIPNDALHITKKLEHLRDKCLNKTILFEFTGGLEGGIDTVTDYYDGLQRLHLKYGRKTEAYPQLMHQLHSMQFRGKSAEEVNTNLTKLIHICHELTAIDPSNDVNKNAQLVYDHLKQNSPGSIWAEIQAYNQMNLSRQESRGEWRVLMESSIVKYRELISRKSYAESNSRSPYQKISKPKEFSNPNRRNEKSAPRTPESALVAQDKRKRRNFEKSGSVNQDRKLKLRAFFEAASSAFESPDNSEQEEAEESENEEIEEDSASVAKFEADHESEPEEENDSEEDDENVISSLLRKFDHQRQQRDQRSKSRNFEPRKVFPPKKPGYAFINNEEVLIVDLGLTKKPPCLLDGQNHALIDCPLKSYQRAEIFDKKNLCQRCLKTGHKYLACPYKKSLKAYCESCKKLGHWNFSCLTTLDNRDQSSADSGLTEKSDKNKGRPPEKSSDVIKSILKSFKSSTPQIPGGNCGSK
jgi:hypothetical protein